MRVPSWKYFIIGFEEAENKSRSEMWQDFRDGEIETSPQESHA